MKRLLDSIKASMDITGVIVDVVLVVALIPIVVSFINSATNLSPIEVTF
jgi:hypothetical protein